MQTKGFIKNISLLEEKISTEDRMENQIPISELCQKIDTFNNSVILGIVGDYGIGKSSLIESVKNKREDKKEEEYWVDFDAWQFPDKRELWDGLILATAKQFGKEKEIKCKLDGNSDDSKKTNIGITSDIINSGAELISTISPSVGLIIKTLTAIVGAKSKDIIDKTPATRVFEMQDIFLKLLENNNKKKIIFVLEDIDRAGQGGFYFLETFKQFIKSPELNKQIIAIVPVSTQSYENINTQEVYFKCMDYIHFYKNKVSNLNGFLSDIFELKNEAQLIILQDLISAMFRNYSGFTMRKLKLALRIANQSYVSLKLRDLEPNPIICVAVELLRYSPQSIQTGNYSSIKSIIESGYISSNDEINRAILISGGDHKRYSNEILYILGEENKVAKTRVIHLKFAKNLDEYKEMRSTPFFINDPFNFQEERNDNLYLPAYYFFEI